jgi:hypothetical protein
MRMHFVGSVTPGHSWAMTSVETLSRCGPHALLVVGDVKPAA